MRALALISGGLDSALAAGLIQSQGIEAVGLYFEIPFSNCEREMLSSLGVQIKYIDIKEKFLRLLENPRYGFGANMNPCIDCKILMFKEAKELMQGLGADFIVSGEVLGQRPMSQNRQALELIARSAGLQGLLLRPLSARLLDETVPEKEGWVNRDKLLNFSGRSRRPQMELAKKLNITDYPNPAGGCLLTDPGLNAANIELLKIGRHFRLACNTKLVVGRNEKENARLVSLAKENDYLFFPNEELAGPTSLGRGVFDGELIKVACQITCRYCDLNNGTRGADVLYKKIPAGEATAFQAVPIADDGLRSLCI
jgi:tRNA-specific 2-thiouridylase